jgi:dTMP kinase
MSRLIVFEGPEGAGKTTQLQLVATMLRRRGDDVATFREPGGTPVGDAIRTVLLDPGSDVTPTAEALLFMASRAQLVEREIRPALDRGATVLLDRFFLATYAYQAIGRGLEERAIRSANQIAAAGLVPDLTLLFRLPVEVGLARAFDRNRGGHDRMERADRAFHERVARGFDTFADPTWQAAHPECGRIVAIDATGTPDDVFARVVDTFEAGWPGSFRREE